MSDNAQECPCKECEHLKTDKEPTDSICYNCDKRIIYDLSLTDPRLIPEFLLEDITRIGELKEVDLKDPKEKKPPTPTWQINKKLDRLAAEDGFSDGYLPWLKYLYDVQGMSMQEIADLCELEYTIIRTRLKSDTEIYGSRPWVNEDRYCQLPECNKLLVRKRYKPTRLKRLGKLEANKTFLNRKYCNRKCSAIHRKQKEKKNDNNNKRI